MDNVFIRKEISFFGVVRKKNIMLQPESSNVTYLRGDITDQLWTGSEVDWLVWPPTQIINFYFLSSKYRVMYINIVTMLYDVFLSYIKHNV